MSHFPESFNSLEKLSAFIGSLTTEEFSAFSQGKYHVSDEYDGREFRGIAGLNESLLKAIYISDKNNYGFEITDKTTGVRVILDYLDLACVFINKYPLRLTYDTNSRIFPRIGFCTPHYAEFMLDWKTTDRGEEDNKRTLGRLLSFSMDAIEVMIGVYSPIWYILIGGDFGTGPPDDFFATYDVEMEFLIWTVKFSGELPDDIEKLIAQTLYHFNSNLSSGSTKMSIELGLYARETYPECTDPLPKIFDNQYHLGTESKPYFLFQSARDFLGYYRVLEYFFLRARSNEIEQIRWNNNLSADEFITAVERIYRKTELKSLEMLVRQVVTESIFETAIKVNILSARDAESLARNIYEKRNSLVHAKENEEAAIPSVFPYYDSHEKAWTELMRLLAINAIEKYCQ